MFQLIWECLGGWWCRHDMGGHAGLYELAIRLAKQHLSAEEAEELREEWNQDTVYTYPLLFGMDQNDCHGSDLKIYVTWHDMAAWCWIFTGVQGCPATLSLQRHAGLRCPSRTYREPVGLRPGPMGHRSFISSLLSELHLPNTGPRRGGFPFGASLQHVQIYQGRGLKICGIFLLHGFSGCTNDMRLIEAGMSYGSFAGEFGEWWSRCESDLGPLTAILIFSTVVSSSEADGPHFHFCRWSVCARLGFLWLGQKRSHFHDGRVPWQIVLFRFPQHLPTVSPKVPVLPEPWLGTLGGSVDKRF